MIYLDHAATSWPKPPEVLAAMRHFMERAGGNPGRSGHRLSIEAGRIVFETRDGLAQFFGISDPSRVLFTMNATHAVNLALRGLLKPGDRIVTGGMEHNAVMRPLRSLEEQGINLTIVPADPKGCLDPERFEKALLNGARLVVVNHASNVSGSIAPIEEIAKLAHAVGAWILVDAAQTGGILPIHMTAQNIDLLAFTGHKSLQGPTGTGGLIISDSFDPLQLQPLVRGGTGSRSEFEVQPDDLPDRFESGTPNGIGIAGLGASVAWIQRMGLEKLRAHELELSAHLRQGLADIPKITVYGPEEPKKSTGVISIRHHTKRVSEIGYLLDEEHGIYCRVGLHCAPAAHRSLGTFPEGTVRLAVGPITKKEEIDQVLLAIERIATN